MKDFDYDALDPGIRFTVKWLHERGFTTTDSGDGSKAGEMEGALDIPHVAIKPGGGEHEYPSAINMAHLAQQTANRLSDELWKDGFLVEPGTIQATYDPADSSWAIMLYAALENPDD